MIPQLRSLFVLTGGNTNPPQQHHKARKTGRLWAITTTREGDRVVFFRDNRPTFGGVA